MEGYIDVSRDVWAVFKKFVPESADLDEWASDIHALDEKYKDSKYYSLMQELLKAYFHELCRKRGNSYGVNKN